MKRRLFNLAAAVSLLLLAAVVGVWIRSYSGGISVTRTTFRADVTSTREIKTILDAQAGRLGWRQDVRVILNAHLFGQRVPANQPWHFREPPAWFVVGEGNLINRMGFGSGEMALSGMSGVGPLYLRYGWMPCWLPAVLTAVLPLCWLRSRLRRRPRPGHCRSCGYDLRATPDHCPECGTAAGVAA